jgi:hypothetical protein
MNKPAVSAAAVVATLTLATLWLPQAKSQVMASPSYVPVGVSASGNTSTAWFHEPSARQVLACQTVVTAGAGLSSIHCVTAKVP